MSIKLLSTEVSSKIAAGEVIERPSSVVKELIENSLDAGADNISIAIDEGGIELISITDNGIGIESKEVELAFKRYSTSKISSIESLNNISTLGFRGEALASISSVSRLTLITRSKNNDYGTKIILNNGLITEVVGTGAPLGTSISVENLFGNFPARKKFLRSAKSEFLKIKPIVTKYSLAFPEVKFTLTHNDRVSFQSPGSKRIRDVISPIYNNEISNSLLEINPLDLEKTDGSINISGLISPPSLTYSNRTHITYFVNKRLIQNSSLNFALEQAYKGFLSDNRHPLAIINISVPNNTIDVNVHPSKTEIRFQNEEFIFSCVQRVVRNTLLTKSSIPSANIPQKQNPTSNYAMAPLPLTSSDTQSLDTKTHSDEATHPDTSSFSHHNLFPILHVIGQLQNTYVVTEGPDGMYLIDQHAAHERILLENLSNRLITFSENAQSLLEPLTISLTSEEEKILEQHSEELKQIGFEIDPFGPRNHLLRAIPQVINPSNAEDELHNTLNEMLIERNTPQVMKRALASIACHSAIKAGDTLSIESMKELIQQLEKCIEPHTCAHGRPTTLHLKKSSLDYQFGRT
ncbi:MAG: hypothetical protein CL735_01225 [Chloroflexi bacterium]|nr:hypothetical protein [Chloroflexota bacterium]|tara:strand:+ start:15607 stop:17340 length:1734 start_codon:yes stop_codon:yes gene_type:complete